MLNGSSSGVFARRPRCVGVASRRLCPLGVIGLGDPLFLGGDFGVSCLPLSLVRHVSVRRCPLFL